MRTQPHRAPLAPSPSTSELPHPSAAPEEEEEEDTGDTDDDVDGDDVDYFTIYSDSSSEPVDQPPKYALNPISRSSSLAYSFGTELDWVPPNPRIHDYPVRHPRAAPHSLLLFSNIPYVAGYYHYFRDPFVLPSNEVPGLGSGSGRPYPIWMSYNPKRASALFRFSTSQDAVTAVRLLEQISKAVARRSRWRWLHQTDVRNVADDEVPAAHGTELADLQEWLRVEDGQGGPLLASNQDDPRKSILVEGIPDAIPLSNLVAVFVPPQISLPSPSKEGAQGSRNRDSELFKLGPQYRIKRLTFVPSLQAHGILRSCCVLHYGSFADAQQALPGLPSTMYHYGEEYPLTYRLGNWAEESKLGYSRYLVEDDEVSSDIS